MDMIILISNFFFSFLHLVHYCFTSTFLNCGIAVVLLSWLFYFSLCCLWIYRMGHFTDFMCHTQYTVFMGELWTQLFNVFSRSRGALWSLSKLLKGHQSVCQMTKCQCTSCFGLGRLQLLTKSLHYKHIFFLKLRAKIQDLGLVCAILSKIWLFYHLVPTSRTGSA